MEPPIWHIVSCEPQHPPVFWPLSQDPFHLSRPTGQPLCFFLYVASILNDALDTIFKSKEATVSDPCFDPWTSLMNDLHSSQSKVTSVSDTFPYTRNNKHSQKVALALDEQFFKKKLTQIWKIYMKWRFFKLFTHHIYKETLKVMLCSTFERFYLPTAHLI